MYNNRENGPEVAKDKSTGTYERENKGARRHPMRVTTEWEEREKVTRKCNRNQKEKRAICNIGLVVSQDIWSFFPFSSTVF
jgi:hypothetical protein